MQLILQQNKTKQRKQYYPSCAISIHWIYVSLQFNFYHDYSIELKTVSDLFQNNLFTKKERN